MSIQIEAEKLAYWYLRLNGFLTTLNFVVHPDMGADQRTDVDVLGVRFPYRAELLGDPMRDDDLFCRVQNKPLIVFAEVKRGRCALNGPWTRPYDQNMQRVLRALGAFSPHEVDHVADSLYKQGLNECPAYRVCLMGLGSVSDPDLRKKYPFIQQMTWTRVKRWMFSRFQAYREQKCSHGQWDDDGKALWRYFEGSQDSAQFDGGIELNP